MTKTCPSCNIEKPSEEFHLNSTKKDGLDWRCKLCKKKSVNKLSQKRRDAKRYEKDSYKNKARDEARRAYEGHVYKCSVLNCNSEAEDLHHVTYKDPLAVVPLCKLHHRMNHEL